MTEADQIFEYLRETIRAIEEAHGASQELKQNPNHATFDAFRARMAELQERLSRLQEALGNEEAYIMDELVDALHRMFSGQPAAYRRTPRFGAEESSPKR